MNCPSCNTSLQMTERKNVEIDYCPKCRGVWLDRGELDKLLETASAEVVSSKTSQHDKYQEGQRDRRYDDRGDDRRHYKKKSLLSEIFDF